MEPLERALELSIRHSGVRWESVESTTSTVLDSKPSCHKDPCVFHHCAGKDITRHSLFTRVTTSIPSIGPGSYRLDIGAVYTKSMCITSEPSHVQLHVHDVLHISNDTAPPSPPTRRYYTLYSKAFRYASLVIWKCNRKMICTEIKGFNSILIRYAK